MAYEDKELHDILGLRTAKYPEITEQLDALWHDVNNGIFGEGAKESSWFKMILSVKEELPKP